MWTGSDCSLRSCPVGPAWATNAADPHDYSECSNQGICNRATGECECFNGFDGAACSRMTCPNDCSGNGRCLPISDVPTAIPYGATNWDAGRLFTCLCDAGFRGADCSERYCPTGDDPLTLCTDDSKDSVQEIRFTLGSELLHRGVADTDGTALATSAEERMDLFGATASSGFSAVRKTAGQMRVTFTDSVGRAYVTHAIDNVLAKGFDANAIDNQLPRASLEAALESLPDQVVPDVKVTSDVTSDATTGDGGEAYILQRRWLVTFVHNDAQSSLVGLQNPLKCDTGYSCTEPGCQPMVQMPFLFRYASTSSSSSLGASATAFGPKSVAAASQSNVVNFYVHTHLDTTAFTNKNIIRLASESQPQLPVGVDIDTKSSRTVLADADYDFAGTLPGSDTLTTTVTLPSSLLAVDKAYNGWTITITSGSNKGLVRTCTSYSALVCTVTALAAIINTPTTFTLTSPRTGTIYSNGGATTVTIPTTFDGLITSVNSYVSTYYVGWWIEITSGSNTYFSRVSASSFTAASGSAPHLVTLTVDTLPVTGLAGASYRLHARKFRRYDARILVAVVDPASGDASDSSVDVFYTKVVTGHANIFSDSERVGTETHGVWRKTTTFTPTLNGFTFQGPIPAGVGGANPKVTLSQLPGAILEFPDRNLVSNDGQARFFEIAIKLPDCNVAVSAPGNVLKTMAFIAAGSNIPNVDKDVENIECSARGSCNRGTGQCECFGGYAGAACQTQSVLV